MQVSVIDNVHWKELGLLFAVWIMILALEIGKVGKFEFLIDFLHL